MNRSCLTGLEGMGETTGLGTSPHSDGAMKTRKLLILQQGTKGKKTAESGPSAELRYTAGTRRRLRVSEKRTGRSGDRPGVSGITQEGGSSLPGLNRKYIPALAAAQQMTQVSKFPISRRTRTYHPDAISPGFALVINPLCRGQQRRTMRHKVGQIGIPIEGYESYSGCGRSPS
jgi:hypothetical protein